MPIMSKSNIARAVALITGAGVIGTIGMLFVAVVKNHQQDLQSKTSTALKVPANDVLTDEQASQIPPGPPTVPVVINAIARVSSELGPQVVFAIGNADVEKCPAAPEEGLRLSQTQGPSSKVDLAVKGGWCVEVKPDQTLIARTLPGELLDVRTDSYVAGDTNVEYVEFEMPDGTRQAIVAAAVNVCDNDGRCVATGVIEKSSPQKVLSMRLPLTSYSDVVVYGPRSQFGGQSESSAYVISSFPEVVALVNEPRKEGDAKALAAAKPAEAGDEEDEEKEVEVYDDDSPEVNKPR